MKVILVNGSSRKNGCTNAALTEVERALKEEGIETEMFFIGNQGLPDCIACGKCRELGRCVFDDAVNEFVEKAAAADGFVFGSPVYYAHPSGPVCDSGKGDGVCREFCEYSENQVPGSLYQCAQD